MMCGSLRQLHHRLLKPGAPLSFGFTLTNHLSTINAGEQLILQDVLPPGFTATGYQTTGGPDTWTCPGGSPYICTLTATVDYPAGSLPGLSIDGTAPDQAGNYTNCADLDVVLANNDEDDVPQNNKNRCTTFSVPGHLSVTKTSDQTEYDLNAPIVFTVTITNPATASTIATPVAINLSDAWTPLGLTFVSATWPWAGCSGLPCTPPGPINPGDQFTIVINAIGSTPGYYTNCFNLTLVGADNVPPPGNAPCVSFYVGHDVAISKSVDNSTPQFGATVTFTLPVSNNLSSIDAPPTEQIVVMDTLPVGLTLTTVLSTLSPPWTCGSTGGGSAPTIITCTHDFAAPAGSALPPIILQAQVDAWGVLNNCASVALVNVTDDILNNNGPACASVKAQEGSLTVQKVVSGPYSYLWPMPVFPIDVTCTDPQANVTTNNLSVQGNTSSAPIQNLPVGTVCQILETPAPPPPAAPAGCTWQPPVGSPQTVTIASGPNTKTVANRYTCDLGSFQITKHITNTTWPSGSTFIFHASCTYYGSSVFNQSSGPLVPPTTGGTVSWGSGSLPYGTICTVTEPTLPPDFGNPNTMAVDSVCTWQQQPPLSQTVTINGLLTGVTMTNFYTCHKYINPN